MKEQAYQNISSLVKRFEEQLESYKSGSYNETSTRRDFIDPFFKALGWDMDNSQGAAEAYREVIHEDKVTVGEQKKSPDYSFRLPGGKRLFFVEAKKPAIYVKEEIPPAYQIRRYAWSAKLPISILTDFEEFAVYDCSIKPKMTDKAAVGRIKYLTFKEYLTEFDFLWDTFAKENVIKGSFDKYVQSDKNKKGTATVDKEFLASLDEWRKLLAVDISKNNKKLDESSINYAVQQTIDRIIFLRICEDRGIEPSERLKAYIADKNCYKNLFEYFIEADKKYNSGLFDFKKDKLSQELEIDDKALKEIIRGLYYPECPFEFSVLPVEILGSAYEQFLGKVIRLTAGHNAKVEEKPEVRKAGGVYYTPQYIVDYIVKNTVGKQVEGKTPEEVEKIKIVDPACGSGSFLLGAYQFLLDWHLQYYIGGKKKKDALTPDGKLTTAIKKKILLNNIYGVDLDAQAVEVTKLSLLLKCMEGETEASVKQQLSMFHERVLPSLETNIKCGNSLIGTDYYSNREPSLFADDDESRKINAFDWDGKDGFSEIMKAGGFDVVLGNPPYIRMEEFKNQKDYLKSQYSTHDERSDLYSYFIEKGHSILSKNGHFGMIVSNKFLRSNYGRKLRNFISENHQIIGIVDFAGLPVFSGATVRTIILLTKSSPQLKYSFYYVPPPEATVFKSIDNQSTSVIEVVRSTAINIPDKSLKKEIWSLGNVAAEDLLQKLKTSFPSLKQYCEGRICRGIVSGLTKAFVIDSQTKAAIIKQDKKAAEIIKPYLNGRDIKRYHILPTDSHIIYTYHGINIDHYPTVKKYLENYKDNLKKRANKQDWYELQQPQYKFKDYFEKPKIIFPDIATEPRFVIDNSGCYSANTTYFIPGNDLYLLALLNSKIGHFYFSNTCAGLEGSNDIYLRFFGQYLEGFPVRLINRSSKIDGLNSDKIQELVTSMIQLNKYLFETKIETDRTSVQRKIDATDREIDKLVYELYGLTEDEIKIVEESCK